jgi:hypothetical protein
MPPVAYALRDELAGTVQQVPVDEDGNELEAITVPAFTGGVIVVDRGGNEPDGFDVREAIDEGGGLIVVDENDAYLIGALDQYPALKRVPAPEDAKPAVGYEHRRATDLREELERRGVTGAGSASKADLVSALEAWDARTAELDAGENLGEVTLAWLTNTDDQEA